MIGRRVCVYLPHDVAESLASAARETGQSASSLVAAALRATDLVVAGKLCALETYIKAIGCKRGDE